MNGYVEGIHRKEHPPIISSVSPASAEVGRELRHQLVGIFPLVVLLSLALCAANLWGVNKGILGLFHDDGLYAVVAKSLSEGEGYRIISHPSSPPQTKYPFVYSFILSGIWWLNPSFPENIFLLKAVNVFFLFAILLLSHALYCKNTDDRGIDALLYVFLVGGNLFVFSFTDYTLSDTLFISLTLLALILCGHRYHLSSTPPRIALIAGITAVAYLTRQAGIPLILAGILHLVMARRGRDLFLYLFILMALVSPWILWQLTQATDTTKNSLLAYYVSYETPAFFLVWSDPLRAIQIVWGNIHYLFESFDLVFLLPSLPGLRVLVYPLLIWGAYVSFRRQSIFFNSFLLLYLLLILAWPFHPQRYILPLIPVAVLIFFDGMHAAESFARARVVSPRKRRVTALLTRVPLALILVFNLTWLSFYLQGDNKDTTRAWYGQRLPYGWGGFAETFAWIRKHTKEGEVLATAYDPMYYLYTGRRTVRPWFHKPETYFYPYGKPVANLGAVQEIKKELVALGVRYLIIDPLDGYEEKQAAAKLFTELLCSYPVRPELVFVSSDSRHKVYSLPLTDGLRHG